MNQGRIWCVVHPTVGLPLLLGSVAITSLVVHASILTHTNWMSSYWAGKDRAKVALEGSVSPVALLGQNGQPAFVITVAPTAGSAGQAPSYVITMAPKAAATVGEAADHAPEKLADSSPPLK